MEVAHFVPKSMKLFGIDIDLSQCPPQQWLPSNVTLYKWDAYSEVPEELLESFDVVVMRDMTLAVRTGDPSLLLKNVLKLLSAHNNVLWSEFPQPCPTADMSFRTRRSSPMGRVGR